MGLKIVYNEKKSEIQAKQIAQLRKGEVFMNSVHDPLDPSEVAGLYLCVEDADSAIRCPEKAFAVSLRGATLFSYKKIQQHTSAARGNVWLFDVIINANVSRVFPCSM